MSFPKKALSLSLAVLVLMSATACSDFISVKDEPTPEPYSATTYPAAASPAPYPGGDSTIAPYSPVADEALRLRTVKTINRMVSINKSHGYRKLIADYQAALPASYDASGQNTMTNVFRDNEATIADINEVLTFSDAGLVKAGAVNRDSNQQEKDYMRNLLVLERFSEIAMQLDKHDGVLDISDGVILAVNGKFQFKSDQNVVPKAIVTLQNPGINKYTYIAGFEGLYVEKDGSQLLMDGEY